MSLVNAVLPIWPLQFWLVAKWAPLFVAGGIFYAIRVSGVSAIRLALLGAAFVLAQFYAVQEAAHLSARAGAAQLSTPIVTAAITLFFVVFGLISMGKLSIPSNPAIKWCGLLTYPVYVVHQNVGYMLFGAVNHVVGSWYVSLLFIVALIVGVAWAISRYVERPLSGRLRDRINGFSLRLRPTPQSR